MLDNQRRLGNRWAFIASMLPGRTENAVKTRFKSIMRAKRREWSQGKLFFIFLYILYYTYLLRFDDS